MIHLVIHGTGRMAAAIAEALNGRDDLFLQATVGPEAPDWASSAPHYFSLDDLPAVPALLIDFTLPEGTLAAAKWCGKNDVALLSGVTGLQDSEKESLQDAAEKVPVLWSPNLSLGVNLLAALVRQTASVLAPDVSVAIEDVHHQWKKDAPSGTALMLGEAVTAHDRDGIEVEFASVREGEEIGVHTVSFTLEGEQIDLVHRAFNRSIYALGALSAGIWLIGQAPDLYSAEDWLSARISASV
jgi:4-hydroxy-tetrahydrodipicolinate reductase